MQVQEMVLDKENAETATNTHFTPAAKLSRNDVSFPLTTPRRRAPSTASLADLLEPDGKSVGRLTIRARSIPSPGEDKQLQESLTEQPEPSDPPRATFFDLPLEVQNKVIDFIFGDIHSVTGNNHSLRGKNVSSLMRHPRRKAVSDFALVTKEWRVLVQERIFRHIKVKGTRAGLQECEEFFASNMTLAGYVRHIEVWVPVWGDKGSPAIDEPFYVLRNGGPRHLNYPLANQPDEMAADPLGLTFRMAAQTATLSEIFEHISIFFDKAKVFTLEGGHCKKSNMIRHFPRLLFNVSRAQQLKKLSNIRTFAMRGSWKPPGLAEHPRCSTKCRRMALWLRETSTRSGSHHSRDSSSTTTKMAECQHLSGWHVQQRYHTIGFELWPCSSERNASLRTARYHVASARQP
jgi:hypothetical protein